MTPIFIGWWVNFPQDVFYFFKKLLLVLFETQNNSMEMNPEKAFPSYKYDDTIFSKNSYNKENLFTNK